MSLLLDKKCETCGAQVTVDDDGLKAVCGYCGSRYTFAKPVTPKSATDISRAENYRQRNLFDNAIVEYKTLLGLPEYADNAEVYWGLFLSEYGIEYVHDKHDDVYVPTCHRTVKTPVYQNKNYLAALKYAAPEMRETYAARGTEIADIQEGILTQAALEGDYDVFLCFKSTDKKAATEDRYISRKIFDELTKRGFRVFFSEVTLKNKLGSDYEPIIYKALSTARVMLLICTDENYLGAPFVRNEWSRFKDRMKEDRKLSLIPVFKNVHHSALPTKEQGVDLDKYPAGGYEIDIADNLESLLGKRTLPKVDKEILEEYAQYNEINKQKFEKSYQKALREVDLSRKRTKNAGKEFEAKAEEMHELGDYRNAPALALEYEKKADFYLKKEKAIKTQSIVYHVIKMAVLFASIVMMIIYMVNAASNNIFSNLNDTALFQNLNIMTIVVLSLTLISIIVYMVVDYTEANKKAESAAGKFFSRNLEIIIYCLTTVIYFVSSLICLASDTGGTNALIYFIAIVLSLIILGATAFLKKGKMLPEAF